MANEDILVVEDDADLRDLVGMLLQAEGYAVRSAVHGREALDRVAERMPDLILLDMKMPVMNGWEFARELRARWPEHAPVVVMTAADQAAKRMQEIGAEGWIAKPFGFDDLLDLVRRNLALDRV